MTYFLYLKKQQFVIILIRNNVKKYTIKKNKFKLIINLLLQLHVYKVFEVVKDMFLIII